MLFQFAHIRISLTAHADGVYIVFIFQYIS